VLVVGKVVPDDKRLKKSREFSEAYKRWYEEDLRQHVDGPPPDAPRTKRIRPKNIILGGSKSHWFGKRAVNLVPILRRLKMKDVAKAIGRNRVVRKLTDDEADRLFDEVMQGWRKARPISTPPLRSLAWSKKCQVCR
jgi:hypothetical protein